MIKLGQFAQASAVVIWRACGSIVIIVIMTDVISILMLMQHSMNRARSNFLVGQKINRIHGVHSPREQLEVFDHLGTLRPDGHCFKFHLFQLLMEDLRSVSAQIEDLRAGCPMQGCGVGKGGELGALWRRWLSLRRGIGLLAAHARQRADEWRDLTASVSFTRTSPEILSY